MRRLKLTIAYRGTAYHGFQVQQNALTVAEVFQDAVESVFGQRYDIKGCSRTDSGVHARGFVLSMDIAEAIPCPNIIKALNHRLPGDIAVLDCQEAEQGFHPRYSATGKRYLYRIWNAPQRNPFLQDTALHQPRPLDAELMNTAARHFLGSHDFSAFCAAGGSVQDHRRTITQCGVCRRGELVEISITGNGFLYNMVRIIAGTLMEVSLGRLTPEDIPLIIESRDRSRAGATAPAHGLFLDCVFYD